MFTMVHGPYVAEVEQHEECGPFHGVVWIRAENGTSGFSFHAPTWEQLREEFAISAREYEAACRERGREPART
jgi:predicted HicB family RNase H-like nuclease